MLQVDKKKCTGCGVCAYICPHNIIEMKKDKDKFIIPIVKKNLCVGCGLCDKVCPVNNKKNETRAKECYIAQLKDDTILKECASGGAFYGISEYVLNLGGTVFGVGYIENSLKYLKITEVNNLAILTKSKYFQCELNKRNYMEIVEESKKKLILVSGTPCQISAIKNLPDINRNNTIFLEILCQGVPNEYVINKYNYEKEKRFNKKIVMHIFRSKDKYIGRNYLNKYMFSDGSVKYYIGEEDPLSLSFQRQMFLRESCYKCEYSNENRVADFTVGDYWNNNLHNEHLKLEKGLSCILCNTKKSQEIMNAIDTFYLEKADYKDALKNNIPFHKSVRRPIQRNYSYKLLKAGIKPSIVTKIICYRYYIKKACKKLRRL